MIHEKPLSILSRNWLSQGRGMTSMNRMHGRLARTIVGRRLSSARLLRWWGAAILNCSPLLFDGYRIQRSRVLFRVRCGEVDGHIEAVPPADPRQCLGKAPA